jgi:Acetyltransferase (GNAT) domain
VTVEIREASAADAPGIRRVFQNVFGSPLSEEEWRWKFEQNPDGWRGVVAVLDGDVVGTYLGWGARFVLDGEERLLYSVGDVATEKRARGMGGKRSVFGMMADAFFSSVAATVPFCYGFPGARHEKVSEKIVGSRTLFPIELVHVPAQALGAPPSDMETGDVAPEGHDALWRIARRELRFAAVRDRTRVNWRFHARPARHYRMVWRRQGSEVMSWAALSVWQGAATVVDYVGRESGGADLPGLFAAVAEEAGRLGATTLVFWRTPGGPGRGVLEKLPGERSPAGFPMISRVFDEAAVRRFAGGVHLVPSLYDMV